MTDDPWCCFHNIIFVILSKLTFTPHLPFHALSYLVVPCVRLLNSIISDLVLSSKSSLMFSIVQIFCV